MFIKIMSMASVLSLGVTGTAVVTAEPESTFYPVKTQLEQTLNIQADTSVSTNANSSANTQNYINAGLRIGN